MLKRILWVVVLATAVACAQPQTVEVTRVIIDTVVQEVEVTRLVAETQFEEVEVTRVVTQTEVEEIEVTRLVTTEVTREVMVSDISEPERVIEIEIAENGKRFIPDEEPIFDDGLPAAGAEFITDGYIYPAGTLTCNNNECNGVLESGEPEFPDLVMGKWVCRGWHISDGAHTETGPIVVTKQTYQMADGSLITTDGFELSDFDTEVWRAVTGGTGQFLNVRGQQQQSLLGWNGSVGVGLRVRLVLLGG